MKHARRVGTALIALALLSACGENPTAPAPPPPSPSAMTGEIRITRISPEPGATVPVHACAPGSIHLCADQPQLTFDVMVDQDIPEAQLIVLFDSCGIARSPVTSLTAGNRVSLATSAISLSADGPLLDGTDAASFCDLPAATTRIFVRLFRSGRPYSPLLIQDFAHGYTFALE